MQTRGGRGGTIRQSHRNVRWRTAACWCVTSLDEPERQVSGAEDTRSACPPRRPSHTRIRDEAVALAISARSALISGRRSETRRQSAPRSGALSLSKLVNQTSRPRAGRAFLRRLDSSALAKHPPDRRVLDHVRSQARAASRSFALKWRNSALTKCLAMCGAIERTALSETAAILATSR